MISSTYINVKKVIKMQIKRVSLTEVLYALENRLPLYIKVGNDWKSYELRENFTPHDLIHDLNHEVFGLARTK